MEWERRSFEVEMRVSGDAKPKIEGYAAVFEQLSEEMWGFREKIRAGAFTNVLRDDVRALFNHDANMVLGRNRAGTLKLEEDAKGLKIEIDPPDTQMARDLLESVRRGDVNQMSFMFETKTDEWKKEDDGTITRTIVEMGRLWDVSVVTFPAYPQTSASARCLEAVRNLKENGAGSPISEAHMGTAQAGTNGPEGGLEPTNGETSRRASGGPGSLTRKMKWLNLLGKL